MLDTWYCPVKLTLYLVLLSNKSLRALFPSLLAILLTHHVELSIYYSSRPALGLFRL